MKYKVTFHSLEIQSLQHILKIMKMLFSSIIEYITECMSEYDLVRSLVKSLHLDFPITLPFRRPSQLTAETFLSEIEGVIQSYVNLVELANDASA
jgi:hypothetical protein